MSKVRAYSPVLQFFNDDGSPMVGGHLETYKAGTSIPVATYANESGTLNPVSIPLNSRGECTVFIVSGMKYKFILKDKDGVVKWTADNYGVNGSGGGGGSGEDIYEIAMFDLSQAEHGLYDDIAANLGAGLLPIIAAGSQGQVRYYYYTARDSQAHTMTFTCGYNSSVELLVLKDDDTYTLNKAVDVPLVRVKFQNGAWSKISGDDGFIKPNPWGVDSLFLPESCWWLFNVTLSLRNPTPRDLIQHIQLAWEWNGYISMNVPPATYEAVLPAMQFDYDFTRQFTRQTSRSMLYEKDNRTNDWLSVAVQAYQDTLPNDLESVVGIDIFKVRDA